jgi:hypothetical protein
LNFNIATPTASTHATNKSYVDTGLATKATQAYVNSQADSISRTNIGNAFTANILNDNTLSSTDTLKTTSTH